MKIVESALLVQRPEHVRLQGFQLSLEERRPPEMLSSEKRQVKNLLLQLQLGYQILPYYLGRPPEESFGMSYNFQEVAREAVSLSLYGAGDKSVLQCPLLLQ